MKKAVIYARYSSNNQREASIEQQVIACQDYCHKNGMTVVNIYSDSAMTGRTDARPNFQRMVLDSQNHTFDYVIVYAIDRFSRDEYDSVVYEHILMQNNVTLLSATEPFSDDPSGSLVKTFFRGYAQYYSKELARKVKRGLEDNARKFLAPASVPFGFDRGNDGKYVINEYEASIVREIFQRVLNGEKHVDIFEDLNARGVKTKRGAKWNKSSFNSMLTNDRYIGTHTYKDTKVEDAIPLIVDKNIFWKVNMKKGDKIMSRKASEEEYLLTGILYCSCGEHMIGLSGTGRNGNKVMYYQCSGKKNHSGCERKNIRKDYLEQLVAESVRDLCMDDECIRWIANDAIKVHESDLNVDKLPMLRNQLARADRKMQNYINAIGDGFLNETLKENIRNLENEQRELKIKIADIERKRKDMMTVEKVIAYLTIYKDIELVNEHLRSGIIKGFVRKITLEDDKMHLDLEVKKESRQEEIFFTDQGVVEDGSPRPTVWRCGDIRRTVRNYRLTVPVIVD